MADTFASYARRVDKFGKAMTDEALSHDMGQEAKKIATAAASADLGGDPKFSGWAPTLDTRYDIIGPGKVSFHPSRRSAGPWTVAESGRNGAEGPLVGRKGRGGKRRRNNGRTAGKGTATEALAKIDKAMPGIVQKQVARAIARAFG